MVRALWLRLLDWLNHNEIAAMFLATIALAFGTVLLVVYTAVSASYARDAVFTAAESAKSSADAARTSRETLRIEEAPALVASCYADSSGRYDDDLQIVVAGDFSNSEFGAGEYGGWPSESVRNLRNNWGFLFPLPRYSFRCTISNLGRLPAMGLTLNVPLIISDRPPSDWNGPGFLYPARITEFATVRIIGIASQGSENFALTHEGRVTGVCGWIPEKIHYAAPPSVDTTTVHQLISRFERQEVEFCLPPFRTHEH